MDEQERERLEHRRGPAHEPRPGEPSGGPDIPRVFAGLGLGLSGLLMVGALTLVTFAQIFPSVLVFGMSLGLGLFSIAGLYREPREDPTGGPQTGRPPEQIALPDTDDPSRTSIAVWAVSMLLAAVFVTFAVLQLADAAFVTETYAEWAYPLPLRWLGGTFALFGSFAIMIPRLSKIGALVLLPVAFGAVYTFLVRGHRPEALIPLVLLVMVVFVLWERSGTHERWVEAHRGPRGS